MRISHLTSVTRTEFLRVTCGRPDIAPQEEGLCQRRRKRGIHEGERRSREEEEGEETSRRVSASSRRWSDNETLIRASQMAWWNTWTLSVSLSHCLLLLLSAPLSLTVSFDWCFVLSRPIFTTFQDFPDFVLSFSFSVVRSLFFFSLCCHRSFFLLRYFSVSCHCCMF